MIGIIIIGVSLTLFLVALYFASRISGQKINIFKLSAGFFDHYEKDKKK